MTEPSWPAALAAMDEDLCRAERALQEDRDPPAVPWSPPPGLGSIPDVHATAVRELLRRTHEVQRSVAARLQLLGRELDELQYRHDAASAYATAATELDSLSSVDTGR